MVEYSTDGKIAYCDGLQFVRDDKTGYYLSSYKIGTRRKRLHVYVWERFNGPVPSGYQVHHKEFDKSKNEISDLQLLTEFEHLSLHAHLQTQEHIHKFHEAGIAAAPAWHHSKAGHEWHKKHYAEFGTAMHKERDFVCENCGKQFKSAQTESRFCSNNCKSAWRRKAGLDNETRICAVCGAMFTTNKYSKQCTCSRKCGAIHHSKFYKDQKHTAHRHSRCIQYAGQAAS